MSVEQYYSVNQQLIDALPELTAEFQEEADYSAPEPPSPHVVYGEILSPKLESELQSSQPDLSFLRRAFMLLESLESSTNRAIREVATISVLEGIVLEAKLLTAAWTFMGPATRSSARDVARFHKMQLILPSED